VWTYIICGKTATPTVRGKKTERNKVPQRDLLSGRGMAAVPGYVPVGTKLLPVLPQLATT